MRLAVVVSLILHCGCVTRQGVDNQRTDEWQYPHPHGPKCEVLLKSSEQIEGRVQCHPLEKRYLVTCGEEVLTVPFEQVAAVRVIEFPRILRDPDRARFPRVPLPMLPKHAPEAVTAADLGKGTAATNVVHFTRETAAKYLDLSLPVRLYEFALYIDGGSIGITLQDWTGKVCCLFEDHSLTTKTGGRIYLGGRKPHGRGGESEMLSVEGSRRAKQAALCLAAGWFHDTFLPEEKELLIAAVSGPRGNKAYKKAKAYFMPHRRTTLSKYDQMVRFQQFVAAIQLLFKHKARVLSVADHP